MMVDITTNKNGHSFLQAMSVFDTHKKSLSTMYFQKKLLYRLRRFIGGGGVS